MRRGQGDPVPDIDWLTPPASRWTDEDWDVGYAKSLAVYLNGHGIRETDERGEHVMDDCFYLAFNASHEPIEFTLPERRLRRGLDDRPRHRRAWARSSRSSVKAGETRDRRRAASTVVAPRAALQ